jgi:hypothetical protein
MKWRWHEMSEEDKYRVWSVYYEKSSQPFDYVEWCNLMDDSLNE